MAVDLAAVVSMGFVVVGTEVVVLRCRVGQEGVGDREDRVAQGHLGLGRAAALGQTPVAGAEAGLGPPGGDRGFAEHPGHVTVAFAPGVAALSPARRLLDLGQNFAQDTRSAGVAKAAMSTPISAMRSWAAVRPTPMIPSSWATWRSKGAMSSSTWAVNLSIWALRRSMLSSIIPNTKPWWSLKVSAPSSASSRALVLARSRPRASSARALGSRQPPMSASMIWRRDPVQV